MDLGLKNKRAIVTGGSLGIGTAVALRLAQEGCDVAINYRRHDTEAKQVVAEIEKMGRRGLAIKADVSLAAHGPWLVTTKGAVLHDSGGYGMLGLGHAPKKILSIMNGTQVMANVMTPHFSQKALSDRLLKEIGFRHKGKKPLYSKFLCLNSGSESVTMAARMSDINAKKLTDKEGPHAGKKIMLLALKGAFHGRTDRPAQLSDSCLGKYKTLLASFRDRDNLETIEPNNIDELRAAFDWAKKNNVFFEALFLEPVMGEGNPGQATTPEFFKEARALTVQNQSLLIVDSIQAGLRAHGCLSIMDYPGFENLDPPDMETYSKALNAGQYPLSVLALRGPVADLHVPGVYGNTMTTNPKALDIACTVLDSITPEFRKNVQDRGVEFVDKLQKLADKFPKVITDIKGTGLLCAVSLDPKYPVVGFGAIEEKMRIKGIGVIHGGKNALRFTPHLAITSDEIDLIIDVLEEVLKEAC